MLHNQSLALYLIVIAFANIYMLYKYIHELIFYIKYLYVQQLLIQQIKYARFNIVVI